MESISTKDVGTGIGVGLGVAATLTVGVLGPGRVAVRMAKGHEATIKLLASEWRRPWVGPASWAAAFDVRAAQRALARGSQIDNEVDAFRHAFAGARLTSGFMRDHGLSADEASSLVRRIGAAHELDGKANVSPLSAQMDLFNNDRGIEIGAGARHPNGSWPSNPQLTSEVLDALRAGSLRWIDKSQPTAPVLRPTDGSTLAAPTG